MVKHAVTGGTVCNGDVDILEDRMFGEDNARGSERTHPFEVAIMAWLWNRPKRPTVSTARIDPLGDPLPPGATVRLGTSRLQHVGNQGNEGLSALAFSPDGTLLAGAGRDGRVSLWDATNGRSRRVLGQHDAEVNCLAFSPDGRLLVTGGRDGQAILWNTTDGTCIYQVEADRVAVVAVAFSPHGDTWAAAGYGPVRIFHAARSDLLYELDAGGEEEENRSERVVAMAFSPDGTHLATASAYTFQAEEISPDKVDDMNLFSDLPALGCEDMMGFIMSDPEGFAERMQEKAENMMKAMKEEYGEVPGGHGFTFGEEGGVTRGWRVGEAGRLTVWRLPAGTPEVSWDMEEGAPYLLAFSADGTVLASVGRDVQAWDLASKRRLAPGRFPARWRAETGFTPQGRTILVPPDGRGVARIWDAVHGREMRTLDPQQSWGPFAFSPEGDRLAVTLGGDMVELRETTTGQELLPLPRYPSWIGGLALSASPVVAVVSHGVHLWDRSKCEKLQRVDTIHRLPALSPDGTRLAGVLTTPAGEANLVVRDWRGNRCLVELEGVEPTVLLFTDNDTLLVGNALGQVGRYDLTSSRWLKIVRGPEDAVDTLAFSPCGRFIAASGADDVLWLWRADTGEALHELALPARDDATAERRPGRLAFSSDGAQLAWGSSAGLFLLWDVAKGKHLRRLRLPEAVETCTIGFDASGHCLIAEATAVTEETQDYRVGVWNMLWGKQVLTTEPQSYPITELAFTTDCSLLASAGADRTVLFWDVSER